MKNRFGKKDMIFIGVIALVHIVFFLLACTYTRIYMGDSFEYIYEALNIKDHLFFYSGNPALPIQPEYMTQRQPLYPLFLLGIYSFTINNWLVIIFQNLLSVFNIYHIRKTLTGIGYQIKYDWLFLLLLIAYPAQFINANTIAPDILLQTFTVLYFANFIALIRYKQLKYAIYMSIALIAGMMVKPVLYPFTAIHAILVIVVAVQQRARLQRPVLIAIIPLCAVLLYNYWNYTRTDKFHFTSNQSFNALYYYYPFISAQHGQDSASHFLQIARTQYDAIPDYKDRYDYANDVGALLLKQNFWSYMAFHLRHSTRIFIEPGKAEIDLFTGRLTYARLYNKEQTGFFATFRKNGITGMGDYMGSNPSMLFVIIILVFNCIRLLGLLLFCINKNIHWLIRWFVVGYAAYFAIAAGPIANTRYFLPVSLIVIGCSVMGLKKMDTSVN